MKRTLITRALAVFVLSLAVCAGANAGGKTDGNSKNKTGLSLMDAIEQTAEKITGDLPAGSRVAIVAFESANDNISDYIMEELTGALFDRKIEVADRQNFEYVYKELNLQMSGDVSDESAKSVGKFLAADMVITGQLLDLDGIYRYRTSAISVETAVRASVTRLDVRSDKAARRMMAALANQKTTVKVAKYGVSADVTPQTAGTFLDRGIMFASRGDYESAIADFNEAIRLDPNMSAAYMLRGRALQASVSQVVGVGENFSSVSISVSFSKEITEAQRRVLNLAVADFTQAIRLDPNSDRAYHGRATAYWSMNDNERAVADYTQSIRLNPANASDYSNRGLAYQDMGDFGRAIADFTQAIRMESNHFLYYSHRGSVYFWNKDFNSAIEDFTHSIRLAPSVDAYAGRGICYSLKGDHDRAIADFEALLKMDINAATLSSINFILAKEYTSRALEYGTKGDFNRAIADWEAVLRINPNDADAKRDLEEAKRNRGR